MLKKLLLVLLLSIPFASFGQQHVLFRDSTTIDSFRLTMWVRQLIPPAVPKINPFFDSVGSAYLAPNGVWWRHNGVVWQPLVTEPDSNVWATLYYVDSGLASISAGAVDTNNYISSIARLNREIDSVSNIIDSNNTIIYGSIAALFDTLPNYVDTAQLNDSLQAIKAAYVPYTGATADVNLGTNNILTNSVRLSASPTGTLTNVGQLYWDATNVTPSIPLNANVTLQMGQEMYIRARNNTGSQINDGQVVYVNDAQGNNPTIALANSDSVNTSIVVGVATENIAINATGFVTTFGVVNGFNTSGFNDGDALYLNTVSGQLSNSIPAPPHNVVKVAIALNSTTNGKIFVQPSEPLGQDTTFAAPYNSNRVAPTQRSIGTYVRKIVKDSASALRTAINTKMNYTDTVGLSNRINLKQNFSDTSTYDATRSYVITAISGKMNYSDTVGLSNRINLKLNSTDTAGLSNRINLKLNSSDTSTLSNRINLKLNSADTASLSNRINAKGSGTVTSVATGFGATGGTITTTGTISVDSGSVATRARVQKAVDSLNTTIAAKLNITDTANIRLRPIAGTNITITGTYPNLTFASTGGGGSAVSATSPRILYKSGSDTLKGATRVLIDSTDGRLVLAQNTDTASVSSYFGGGTKIVGRNRMGMSTLALVDSVSIPAALQRAINAQVTSTIMPFNANYQYTGTFTANNPALSAVGGAVSFRAASYSSTIQQLGYNLALSTTGSGAGNLAGLYTNTVTGSPGIIAGNTKFSGGGGRGTFTFCLPTFTSAQRLYVGYNTSTSPLAGDPSGFTGLNLLGIGKDVSDLTLQFMHCNNSGTVTKVNTGITPNNDDVYRVTVYIAPNSTYYIQLEVFSKTAPIQTVVLNPTTNVPAVGTRLIMRQTVSSGLLASVVSYGFINFIEEIY